MAKWYAEVNGSSKTPATRQGTETSGMSAHIRGWNVGVHIQCFVDEEGFDCIEIEATGGSNRPNIRKYLYLISDEEMRGVT